MSPFETNKARSVGRACRSAVKPLELQGGGIRYVKSIGPAFHRAQGKRPVRWATFSIEPVWATSAEMAA